MVRPILRLLTVTVVLAHVVIACDGGDLNPQPLPPSENSGRGTDSPSTGGSQTGDNAATPVVSDAGAGSSKDGGPDGGDAGDGGQ